MKKQYSYTGNSSFENAYHDCKIVADSIVDEESFQNADTGLVLYYMDRILEALEKACGWIPVSERLPEEDGMYLITAQVLSKFEVQYVFYQKDLELFICNGISVAWMPLPEPPKEE